MQATDCSSSLCQNSDRASWAQETRVAYREFGQTLTDKDEQLETQAGGDREADAKPAARDVFGEATLVAPPSPDRLPPMLFLAALVHGILIIGVTFNAVLGDDFQDAISLEVTIVADPERNFVDTDRAKYLAQASQEGQGNTLETVRASAPTQSSVPIDNIGVEDGDALDESTNQVETADQLLSTEREQDLKVADAPREEPNPDVSTALALEAGLEVTMPLPQDRESTLQVQDDDPRHLVTSVDTKDSKIATYIDRWRRKIETIGVNYFPELGITESMTGSPTLQVTINSSGHLDSALVRKSSGSKTLDQAVLNILRRASPFDPFSEEIRADHDRLTFVYKWKVNDKAPQTAASAR